MDIRRTILVGMILVVAVMLAACATADPNSPPAGGDTLLDTEWALISLNGGDLVEGSNITLRFAKDAIEGSGGCNTYGGSYTASENSLKLRDVYWTEMACMEPEGIMAQEQAYFQALNTVSRYRVDGQQLALYDTSDTQVLVFIATSG